MKTINKTLTQVRTAYMKPIGVVIHNDAGSVYATALQYYNALRKMTAKQLENGFAHYYIDSKTIYRAMDTNRVAWHLGNAYGNTNFIGFEVCQSMGASDKVFLANEEATLKKAAEVLKFYKLPANKKTVRLHSSFSATACPHRSVKLHGAGVKCQNYFIKRIKFYMKGGYVVSKPKRKAPKQAVISYWYSPTSPNLKKIVNHLKKNKLRYKLVTAKNGKVKLISKPYQQYSNNKRKLVKLLEDERLSYEVILAKNLK